ncbi:hypothetical protein ACA910_012716 [Epithemia clementina (nom. ined.)]
MRPWSIGKRIRCNLSATACQYDILQGAQRLCQYWSERLQLFGLSRAFLPLTLTGQGALNEADITTLRAGYPALIGRCGGRRRRRRSSPSSSQQQQQQGQTFFLYVDRRRKLATTNTNTTSSSTTTTTTKTSSTTTTTTTDDSLLRALFYHMALLAADPLSQWDGQPILFLNVSPRSHQMDFSLFRRGVTLVATCFPIRPHIYLVGIPLQKRPTFSQQLVQATVVLLRHYFATPIHICWQPTPTPPAQSESKSHQNNHKKKNGESNTTNSTILEQFMALGFDRCDIPQSFGGYWSFDDYEQWFLERQRFEFGKYNKNTIKDHHHHHHPLGFVLGDHHQPAAPQQKQTTTPSGFAASQGHPIPFPYATTTTTTTTTITSTTTPLVAGLDQLSWVNQWLGPKTSVPPPAAGPSLTAVTSNNKDEQEQEQERLIQKRRISSVLSSRKARDKHRTHVQTLQEQSQQLQQEQERLQHEYQTLSRLCTQAESTVRNLLNLPVVPDDNDDDHHHDNEDNQDNNASSSGGPQ